MHGNVAENELEVLDYEACLGLLSSAEVGRVAWSQVEDGVARVSIRPVNFVLYEGDLLFCTSTGSKLSAVIAGRLISFEVDDIEPAMSVGWSVVATGHAAEVTDPDERRSLKGLVEPWDRSPKVHLVRLRVASLTGRRIGVHPATVRAVWMSIPT
jgi:hypothetical protein